MIYISVIVYIEPHNDGTEIQGPLLLEFYSIIKLGNKQSLQIYLKNGGFYPFLE